MFLRSLQRFSCLFDVVDSGIDMLFNGIQHFSLVVHQHCEVQKHLMHVFDALHAAHLRKGSDFIVPVLELLHHMDDVQTSPDHRLVHQFLHLLRMLDQLLHLFRRHSFVHCLGTTHHHLTPDFIFHLLTEPGLHLVTLNQHFFEALG